MATSTAFAAGNVIEVRDEEWIVSSCERAGDGWKVRCVGSSELVRSTPTTFYSTLDGIEALDPAEAELVQDDSPHFCRSRLWVEGGTAQDPRPAERARFYGQPAHAARPAGLPALSRGAGT